MPKLTYDNPNDTFNKDHQDKRKDDVEVEGYFSESKEDNTNQTPSLDPIVEDVAIPNLDSSNVAKAPCEIYVSNEATYAEDVEPNLAKTDTLMLSDCKLPDEGVEQFKSTSEDLDDDFADFSFAPANVVTKCQEAPSLAVEDDFSDFVDFNDYKTQRGDEASHFDAIVDASLIGDVDRIRDLIKEVYPIVDVAVDDCGLTVDLIGYDAIFHRIKDVTETPAINYVWNKSTSQNALLKSLNIDMRNIVRFKP